MTAALSDRIAATEAKLAALRAKRGAAALDDTAFDATEYMNAEAELEALRDAEGEQIRRERAGAADARGARRHELRGTIKTQELERLAAVSDAQEAAMALVDALKRAMDANGKINEAIHQLVGRVGMGFQPRHFENRLSMYLAHDLRDLRKGPVGGRLGFIEWPNGPRRKYDHWASEEKQAVKGDLALALKGENA